MIPTKHRPKSLKVQVLDGHELQWREAIQFLNQKTAGDSETASGAEVTGFAAGLLIVLDDLGRRV